MAKTSKVRGVHASIIKRPVALAECRIPFVTLSIEGAYAIHGVTSPNGMCTHFTVSQVSCVCVCVCVCR